MYICLLYSAVHNGNYRLQMSPGSQFGNNTSILFMNFLAGNYIAQHNSIHGIPRLQFHRMKILLQEFGPLFLLSLSHFEKVFVPFEGSKVNTVFRIRTKDSTLVNTYPGAIANEFQLSYIWYASHPPVHCSYFYPAAVHPENTNAENTPVVYLEQKIATKYCIDFFIIFNFYHNNFL